MSVLITGAAGFIGYHMAQALLAHGEEVFGVDNLDPYYDIALKKARLARMKRHRGFRFQRLDIADAERLLRLGQDAGIERVLHLAAQTGVRHSLRYPFAYTHSNVDGHTAVLELCRRLPKLEHLVFASSSSVYNADVTKPSAVTDRTDRPISLYGATKKAGELISYAYARLYGIPQTGLRFFTVYGPWGRPDMALYLFTKAIYEGRPISVFNRGDMRRDFTYIDDVVKGVFSALYRPPARAEAPQIYNLGNNRPEPLLRLIALIEQALGRKAKKKLLPMQAGDAKQTYADIGEATRDLGFAPTTTIDVGVPRFVEWFLDYHQAKPKRRKPRP
jgi:UDP-glucuronate 4-epimerase